jgi:hypothetical protein
MRVLWAHLQDEPPDPSADRTDISPEFARALKAALRKEPAERPRSSVHYARSLAEAAGIPIGHAAGWGRTVLPACSCGTSHALRCMRSFASRC